MESNLSIIKKTQGSLPQLPILALKNEILGKNYFLSLAYLNENTIRDINKKYRKKNKPTNVLSFPFSKKEGELVLCPTLIKKESKNEEKNFGKNYAELFLFLVIHGMLHLKGMSHGSRMSKAEKLYCHKYDTKHFYRNRRRYENDKSRGGRVRKK
ncbi:rRNA maturation RNase YbeY [Candidatus Nomurabacteria bacterium]|nr:rRNA maturation RNase YbeY [Candidatus Nomurabacteria bacterium]